MAALRHYLREFLAAYEPFELFGTQHLCTLALSLALLVAVPWFARKCLRPDQQATLGIGLGLVVMLNYPLWVVLEMLAGTFSVQEHLPFHLCRFANLAIPVVMIWRHRRLFEILYFWGFSGILQALFTPSLEAAFPHFLFFRYWIAHSGLMLCLVYATAVYDLRPTARGIWLSLAAMNVFLLVAIPVNLALGSNYFYICKKPPFPTLLDYLGAWPWYIASGEIVALVHFGIAYLPFHLWNRLTDRG